MWLAVLTQVAFLTTPGGLPWWRSSHSYLSDADGHSRLPSVVMLHGEHIIWAWRAPSPPY